MATRFVAIEGKDDDFHIVGFAWVRVPQLSSINLRTVGCSERLEYRIFHMTHHSLSFTARGRQLKLVGTLFGLTQENVIFLEDELFTQNGT